MSAFSARLHFLLIPAGIHALMFLAVYCPLAALRNISVSGLILLLWAVLPPAAWIFYEVFDLLPSVRSLSNMIWDPLILVGVSIFLSVCLQEFSISLPVLRKSLVAAPVILPASLLSAAAVHLLVPPLPE